MSGKFVIRFDDISPRMAWTKFAKFEELSSEYNIPYLLGVVPKNMDESLNVEKKNSNFWKQIRDWKEGGWAIAQHGYTHKYINVNSGLLKISRNSEFVGLSLKHQKKLLKEGKKIMVNEGVWQPIFMAPSHAFDMNTVKALEELSFKYITDGYGFYPYKIRKITAVPQLFASPIEFGFGIYTICLHVNSMSPMQVQNTLSFIRRNRHRIISFDKAVHWNCSLPGVSVASRVFMQLSLTIIRNLLQKHKIKNVIDN